MKSLLVRTMFAAALCSIITTRASESLLDRDFLVETANVYAVIALDSGKILIGGALSSVNGYPRPSHFARLHADGTLDLSFNPVAKVLGNVERFERQIDGTIMKVSDQRTIERLLADGLPDSAFNCTAGGVQAVCTMSDGKVMIGGNFTIVDDAPRRYLARLNSDGSLDQNFSTDKVPSSITAIVGQPDGKVIIGGAFGDIGGTARQGLARLDVSGNLDISFNLGGQALPRGAVPRMIKKQADGSFIVLCDTALFRITSAGVADPSYPATPITAGNLKSIAVDNGGLLLSGNYLYGQAALIRLSSTGRRETNFNVGFNPAFPWVASVDLQQDGKILLAGDFTAVDGDLRFGIARLNATTPLPLGSVSVKLAPALMVSGPVGSKYRIEYSPKVRDAIWSPLSDVQLAEPQFLFIDKEAIGENRFYRAVPVP